MKKAAFIKFIFILTIAAAFGSAAAGQASSQTAQALPVDAALDEVVKFISGIPSAEEKWKALQETTEWKNFAAGLEKSWAELEAKRLRPMKAWADVELADSNAATKVLFYPFGGPDFLTAFLLFPDAETYILLGLEFVGKLPEFNDTAALNAGKHVGDYLANINTALSDFFNKSYFITKNMNATLTGDKVDGVLPVICLFLKRMNGTISAVKRCELLSKGEVLEYDYSQRRKAKRPYGIKVEFFVNGTDKLRTLYYFSCDLADSAFTKGSSLYAHLEGLNFDTTFVKAASYLMHYPEFSNIREMILKKSRFVLQDDTGIPFRHFSATDWDAQLYGEYIKPISDFKGVEQFDLETAYADVAKVKKLPFHLGYHWGTNKDSILYFKKKSDAPAR